MKISELLFLFIVLGLNEANECGKLLRQSGYKFDEAYTSILTRAHQTLGIITEVLNQPDLAVEESWRLNERHYGGLTGLNKAEVVQNYGENEVLLTYNLMWLIYC